MSARDLEVTRAHLPCEFKSSGSAEVSHECRGHSCDQKVSFWQIVFSNSGSRCQALQGGMAEDRTTTAATDKECPSSPAGKLANGRPFEGRVAPKPGANSDAFIRVFAA